MLSRMAAERLAYEFNKLKDGHSYYARFDEQWLIIRATKSGEEVVDLTEDEVKNGIPTARPARPRSRR